MAFTPETFVLCSKFNLFKAHANLWIYSTADTLEDCLATNYFQPRRNLKNQDSPEVGDVIQVIVEYSKLAYLKITAKTEKPYNITVARTFLENEAELLAEITELQISKADKSTDFVTPVTEENLGITQEQQQELEEKIDLAANSGRMITAQGFWYAKMHSETVAPSAEDGTNYADFSQVDGEGNPIIVTYNRVSGAWVQDQIITPPAEFDGYVPITSKIWDIPEQDGQQGGRILWNHVSEQFTPYPTIVAFDSIEITGNSTVQMPQNPSNDNIANVGFVKNTIGAARNIGDVFWTTRSDSDLNGAVPCDGSTYHTTDFTGDGNIGELLALGKIPYVSLAAYSAQESLVHNVGVFGWDGIGTTAFRVPLHNSVFIESQQGNSSIGRYVEPGAPNITGYLPHSLLGVNDYSGTESGGAFRTEVNFSSSTGTGSNAKFVRCNFDASRSSSIYGNSNTIQPQAIMYKPMVQLAIGATDEALVTCTSVLADVANLNSHSVIAFQAPTVDNDYTWYRKYADGWVEQGGFATSSESGTICSFPITMANNKYTTQVTVVDQGASNYSTSAIERATTYIKISNYTESVPCSWFVCGMAA